jgi:outer membrane protein OmpA-like peptidoglycan-associated protein
MPAFKNSTALVAVLASAVAFAGPAPAQDDAVAALVDCVLDGEASCPTGVSEADVEEAVDAIVERTGEDREAVRQRVEETLEEAGVAVAPAEPGPETEAPEEVEPTEAPDLPAEATEEAEAATDQPAGEPVEEAEAATDQPAEEADRAEEAAPEPVEDPAAAPEEADIAEDLPEGVETPGEDALADALAEEAEAEATRDVEADTSGDADSGTLSEVDPDAAGAATAEQAGTQAEAEVPPDADAQVDANGQGQADAQAEALPEADAQPATAASEGEVGATATEDAAAAEDAGETAAETDRPEPRPADADVTESAAPEATMPGADASAQEIAAALSGLEDGPERDELLRRLEERLAEDAEAALPDGPTEAEAPDPEERARREEMAGESAEAALASQALSALGVTSDEPAAEVVERESVVVTEETSRSSTEDVAAALTGTAGEDADRNALFNILGAAAAGFVVGQLLDSGDEVVAQTGDRVIVNRDGEYVVLSDENMLLRRPGTTVESETYADGSTRSVFVRDDGTEVITVRAPDGRILYRARVEPDGRRIVLIDETQRFEPVRIEQLPEPRRVRVIEYERNVDARALAQALAEVETVEGLDRAYSLQQVRNVRELRELMPRIDLEAITFPTGSAAIQPGQAQELSALGNAMARMIEENPDEIFLIEGHTDTVGGEIMNLALSDRRAESVALALTEYFGIPPENMVTQGYGERYLKYPIEGDVRENRRAAVRLITPLLRTAER